MLNKTENEETSLFCQIFVIGGISIEETIEGARTPWATPTATPMYWDKIAPLSSFTKKKKHSKQN